MGIFGLLLDGKFKLGHHHFLAVVSDAAPEQDLDLASVWQQLRDLRLQRVEIFTMTRAEFDAWKHSLGTLAEVVASTGVLAHGG